MCTQAVTRRSDVFTTLHVCIFDSIFQRRDKTLGFNLLVSTRVAFSCKLSHSEEAGHNCVE